MTSSPTSSLQPSQGSPHRWDGFRQWLRGVNRTRKIFEDAFDSSKSPWPSIKGRAKPVAESSADPFLVAKTLTIATRATHHRLDDFCIDQNPLQLSLQSTYWLTESWLLRAPIRVFDPLQCPFPKGALLRTLRRFLKPSPSSSLFSNFSQRVSHWVCGLQVTENRYTTNALVHVRSDKCPKTSSHKEAISDNSVCAEASMPPLQCEGACRKVLNLDFSSQTLNSSIQPGFSCSRCSSSFGNVNDILQVVGYEGPEQTTKNYLREFQRYVRLEHQPWVFWLKESGPIVSTDRQLGGSSSNPEDNASSIKRQDNDSLRAPADGETSKMSPKRQRQSSHCDEGTNGTTKAGKKRTRDSVERDDDDFDDSGRGGGRPNTGKRRKDEEEESIKNKFACPFYKNDPQVFRASRTCVGPGWSSVHRVKEHIFRRHMLSDTQCHDRLEEFGGQAALNEHLEVPCRQKPPLKSSHGINKKQEIQLRSRKMYQKSLDEEEKWRAIYKIIFPEEENIPSPYYEPEVPEFPDYYRQMLIQKLPGIVTEQLRAAGPGLMRHITDNVMANQHGSTSGFGSKSNLSENPQLVRQIENVVEIAVRKTLSEVDRSKEQPFNDFQIPRLNVESPEEESKNSMKQEKQVPLVGLTPLQDDFLLPPGIGGNGLKIETRAQYPTPTSSSFSRSPEFQFGNMERSQMGSTSPLELDLASMFGESHLDDSLLHTAEGGSIVELPSITWDNVSNNDAVFSSGMYNPIRQNSNPNVSNVSGPASDQTQVIANLGPRPEEYLLGSWDFPPQVTSIQSVDSGYGSIAGPPDSTALDNLDLDWFLE